MLTTKNVWSIYIYICTFLHRLLIIVKNTFFVLCSHFWLVLCCVNVLLGLSVQLQPQLHLQRQQLPQRQQWRRKKSVFLKDRAEHMFRSAHTPILKLIFKILQYLLFIFYFIKGYKSAITSCICNLIWFVIQTSAVGNKKEMKWLNFSRF